MRQWPLYLFVAVLNVSVVSLWLFLHLFVVMLYPFGIILCFFVVFLFLFFLSLNFASSFFNLKYNFLFLCSQAPQGRELCVYVSCVKIDVASATVASSRKTLWFLGTTNISAG